MTMTMSFMIMKLINIIERHNYCILLGGYAQMLIYLCWANILIIINQTISQLGYSASALHPVFSNGSRARQNSPELNFLCSVLSLQNGEMFVQNAVPSIALHLNALGSSYLGWHRTSGEFIL